MAARYHSVYRAEGFEEAATALCELVREAARAYPGHRRVLYGDIEGPRHEPGGHDHALLERQREFSLGAVGPFRADAPLPRAGPGVRSKPPRADIPAQWVINPANNSASPDTP
jgi:hypothetical protein